MSEAPEHKETIERELIIFVLGDCKPCNDIYAIRQSKTGRYICYALCDSDGMDGYFFAWAADREKAIALVKNRVEMDHRYILTIIKTYYDLAINN